MEYSHVIVGAGSAGCVLAARLSALPRNQVLVVEAGPAYRSVETPFEVSSLDNTSVLGGRDLLWPLTASVALGQPPVPLQQGRGVGGSSSVNNTWALRARPGDVTRWNEQGWTSLSWQELSAHQDAVVDDGSGPCQPGTLPVRTIPEKDWTPVDRAFQAAVADAGHPWSPDLNTPDSRGAGALPLTALDGRRVSAHDVFLDPALERQNLHLVGDAHVERVEFDGTRAVGVTYTRGGSLTTVRAAMVILSAGAVQSPLLLQRSGIGPADVLADAGVTPIVDLPGVGANLVEHPLAMLFLPLSAHGRAGSASQHQVASLLRPRGGPAGDTWHMACMSRSPAGDGVAVGFVGLMAPTSRGTVRLGRTPEVALGCLSTDQDIDGLWQGLEILADLMSRRHLAQLAVGPLLTAQGPFDALTMQRNRTDFLRRTCYPYRHLAGTCRVADGDDPDAVVDGRHAVRGVENLYVVDASALPDSTSSNLHLTVTAVAHRAAERLASEGAARQGDL